MIISQSASQSGKGTDRFKRVVGLEDAEKQAARDGQDVFFKSDYLSGGTHGTNWRRVEYYGKYNYFPRVPSQEEIDALDYIAVLPNEDLEELSIAQLMHFLGS